ncbi:MAG: hypothetical protein ACRCYO_06540 [Bacteroidia bacterium]
MRVLIFLFALLHANMLSAQTLTLSQCRTKYEKASKDEAVCKSLIDGLKNVSVDKNPVLYGYLGAAETIYAQFSSNLSIKMSRFSAGKTKLEAAIVKDSKSIELRYLRFTVQSGCPAFLNYSGQLTQDKKVILDGLNAVFKTDNELYKKITAYLSQSKNLNAAEKKQFDALVKNNSTSK